MTERLTKIIIGGRGYGKTTKLVAAYNRGDIQKIVVAHRAQALVLQEPPFHVPARDIIVMSSTDAMRGMPLDMEYGYDDYEIIAMGTRIMLRPAIVTMTGEAVVLLDPREKE